jgi:hypothetical protein
VEVIMARETGLRIACAVFIVGAIAIARVPPLQAAHEGGQAAAAGAAADAAKASPDLVNALSKEIGGTPEQAAGAAGSLFGIAKSRLKPEEFSQVAAAVPGMDSLLSAAPAAGGMASAVPGGASGLASAASAFSKLGLSPDMVSKAVPVLTSFVSKSGGANVGSLLAGALK